MTKKTSKKVFIGTMSFFVFLTIVLAIHIYIVTRPKFDQHTIVMARINIKNSLTQADADKITHWLYQQRGIDHVLVNSKTNIVIFTYFPVKTTGDQVVNNFKSSFDYDAYRYVPPQAEMQNGCPVASNSVTKKVYTYIKHIF